MLGRIVRNKPIAAGTLAAIAALCALPPSAEAQLFGGRLRARREANRIERQERLERVESERLDRLPSDALLRRDDRGPEIILPGDSGPSYVPPADTRADLRTEPPAYRYRGSNDYGAGFGARLRDARDLFFGSPPAGDYGRQSVLRNPTARDARTLPDDAPRGEPPSRGERTVRVDRFDDPARVDPPEDRFEPVARDRARSSRLTTRDLRDRDLPRTPSRREAGSAERIDERVEPASATDDFDKPRSARSESSASVGGDKPINPPDKPTTKPKTSRDDEPELLPPPPPDPKN